MYHRNRFELWSDFCQSAIKCMTHVERLFEWRSRNRVWIPPIAIKNDVVVRFDFQAQNSRVWNNHYKIDFGSESPIPWSQVKGMQHNPVIGSGSEHVEYITLPWRRAFIHE